MQEKHIQNVDTPQSILMRIVRQAVEDSATGCLNWSGCVDSTGYGAVKIARKKHNTHRLVLVRLFGVAALDGMDACHHCDNRRCVNPAHLFIGTRRDNMQDARQKGRLANPPAKGLHIAAADLTADMLREMLIKHRFVRTIARELKCTGDTIKRRCIEWDIPLVRTWSNNSAKMSSVIHPQVSKGQS